MNTRLWRGLIFVLATVAFGGVAYAGEECPVEFDDAEFFIEINATDGDAGVQLMLDGVGWKELEMTDPLGNVILEVIFNWPGLGRLFFEAIMTRDYPVVMANTVISAILVLGGVLIADLSYALVDPRISHDE